MTEKTAPKTETKTATPKKPRAEKAASSEVGNLCVHALALYTNATIKERKDDYVLLDIPYTLIVGNKLAGFRVKFKLCPVSIGYDVKNKTIAEIGERMFGFAFDLFRKEPNVLGIDDKPLSTLKSFTVVTAYGDKFIWNNGSYKTVKANAPKKAKT